MVDMLATAQRWLHNVRKDSLSTSRRLTYIVRDTGERIPMEGVCIGSSDERLDISSASTLDVENRDYIVPVEIFERRLRQYEFEPRRGDMIEEIGEDGRVHTFRVMPFGGDTAWEWHDRERTAYRVHCQQVGVKE